MKKIFPIILIIFMLIGLIGCGNSGKQLSGKYIAPNTDGPVSQIISSMEFEGNTVTLTYTDTLSINAGKQTTCYYTLEDGIGPIYGIEGTNLRIDMGDSDDIILENIDFDNKGMTFAGGAGTWKKENK